MSVTDFKCKIVKWTYDHRPVEAEFEVVLSSGARQQFKKVGTITIEQTRNYLTKRLAMAARKIQ